MCQTTLGLETTQWQTLPKGGDKAGAGSDLTAALAEWQDKFIRLQAEFDNYSKRTLKEKMDLVQTGGRDVLLAMLPVRDDVQRAVDAMQKTTTSRRCVPV